jgi:predicted nucleotidyltransferase
MHLASVQIDRVVERLQSLRPAAVYLFGSAAAGRLRPDSDVDLALLPSGPLQASARLALQNDLAELLGRDVHLVDLSSASSVLAKEVIAGGRVIAMNDPRRRAEFEMYALSDYARLNEERAPVLAALGQPLPAHA